MALSSTEAIVLRAVSFGEAHKIVTFFTSEFGKLKIVVKGASSSKNRYGASLESMMISHIVFYNRPAKDLQLLSQADLVKGFSALHKNFSYTNWCLYLMELIDEFTVDRDKNKEIYFLIKNTLEYLEQIVTINKNEEEVLFVLKIIIKYFEINLFKISGFGLQLKTCVHCGEKINSNEKSFYIDVFIGGLLCNKCKNIGKDVKKITGETVKILDMFTFFEISKIQRLKISKSCIKELDSVVEIYRQKYISKELKSLKFISSVEIN